MIDALWGVFLTVMNHLDILVQLVRALATPAASLVALYWFREPIKAVFDAIAYIIKERKIKTSFLGSSLEVDNAVGDAVRDIQKEILVTARPPDNASKVPDQLEARRFVLRDENGRARAEIGVANIGGNSVSSVQLFDAAGNVKVRMSCPDEGSAGILARTLKRGSIAILASEEGGPFLGIANPNGILETSLTPNQLSVADGRVYLGELGDQPPQFLLMDKGGQRVFVAP